MILLLTQQRCDRRSLQFLCIVNVMLLKKCPGEREIFHRFHVRGKYNGGNFFDFFNRKGLVPVGHVNNIKLSLNQVDRYMPKLPIGEPPQGLKESVITRSPGCDHSTVTSYYEWSQVHCPHLSPFSLSAGKNLNNTAVIPLSYSTFKLTQKA